jgi:phosphohistidine phosphatase
MLTHLLLMRHAKSSWSDASLTDHERPLNGRGRRAATSIGQVLTTKGVAPETIWSSDSKRTTETAMRLIRAIPGAQRIDYFSEMYHASAPEMLGVAANHGEPSDIKRLMWLGHNPGWAGLHEHFTGRSHRFPTAACLVLERRNTGNWLEAAQWRPVELILPRDLEM